MDNNTVTITIDRFEKLIEDSKQLDILMRLINASTYCSTEIKAMVALMKEGDENA